ncbi:MAG: hypothetical protein D6B25_00215 [Desulfobulbaceae bacterium]|nr:MAG: hypothetical protein D6B25_00215 [Desulfobulbaceae bacterium]
MKPTNSTKLILLVSLTLLMVFVAASIASAKTYTRSCGAKYTVSPSSFRGTSWSFSFTGKGKIGYYNPNKARERARRNIDECIDTHWARRTATGRPAECSQSNLIYNYPVGSMIVDLSTNICRLNPGHDTIRVNIGVLYSGKAGCTLSNNSWQRNVVRNFQVHCPTQTPLY